MNITKITKPIGAFAGKVGSVVKSPEVLIGVGITAMVAGTVVACVNTKNVKGIVDEAKERAEASRELLEDETNTEYEKKEHAIECIKTYSIATFKMIRNYILPACLIAAGIVSILTSHNMMAKRVANLSSACSVLSASFNEYRSKVIEKYGEDADRDIAMGLDRKNVIITETKKNGKEKQVKAEEITYDGELVSPYAKIFGKGTTVCYEDSKIYNENFLKAREMEATNRLRLEGHLFLNDVYRMLGFEDTELGAVTGWLYPTDDNGEFCGDGAGYVDFGCFSLTDTDGKKVYSLVNCSGDDIYLDFNVDGIMWDKITETNPFRR